MTVDQNRPVRKRLGDFTLLGELGRGGMGVVYRARQGATGRLVALKILPALSEFDGEAVARFRREGEAARRLEHPGIVPIRAVGEVEGVHFLAMDLIDGPSLEQCLVGLRARRPEELGGTLFDESGIAELDPELAVVQPGRSCVGWRYPASCAHIAAAVADALDAAHAAGVIHRDVKPSNILMSHTGRPILVDFGLAYDETEVGLTRSGDAVGTPAYMAPEQATGKREIDARVDVYGLGVTLYELLTTRQPFSGDSEPEILRQIIEQDPEPVRQLNPRVPQSLARIVHCCLAKDPADRYPDAAALSADLRACLDGRPVAVPRPALHRRLGRVLRRHHARLSVASLVLCAAGVAAGLMGLANHHEARRTAEDSLLEARKQLRGLHAERAELAYGRAAAAMSDEAVEEQRRKHALEVFEDYYREGEHDRLRQWLSSWPVRPRDQFWDHLLARAEGRGAVAIEGTGQVGLEVGRIGEDGLFRWQVWEHGMLLPLGPQLVAVTAPGQVRAVKKVTVDRDREATIESDAPAADSVPDGFVWMQGDSTRPSVLIARCETSAGDYARGLRVISDVELRRELLPYGWRDPVARPGTGSPVRGLSFAQARTFAALNGAHLPSLEEQRRAASGGFDGLEWPWGERFDWERVAAANSDLVEPMQVESLVDGASPLGVLHLAGNVREFVLDGPSPRVVGGHFASADPAELRIEAGPVCEADEVDRFAGLRLARFVEVETDARELARLAELRRELPSAPLSFELTESGAIRYPADGVVPALPGEVALAGDEPGEFWPCTALWMRAGHFELELPLTREARLQSLQLPAGSWVDSVDPEPALRVMEDGRTQLYWDGRQSSRDRLRLRFRRDGVLTEKWPTRNSAIEVVDRFFDGMGAEDRAKVLEPMVAPQFLWRPHGVDAAQLRGPLAFGEFGLRRYLDVTAVGPVVSVWALVDRVVPAGAGRSAVTVREVPMVVQFDRRDGRVLGISSAGVADAGQLRAGRYENPELGVGWTIPVDLTVERVRVSDLDMQLVCRAEGMPEGVELQLLGCVARPGEPEQAALFRLTGGATAARASRPLRDPVAEPFGPRHRLRRAVVSEWQFGQAGSGRLTRERWHLIAGDRSWFLIRLVVSGADGAAVASRFADRRNAELIQTVAETLELP